MRTRLTVIITIAVLAATAGTAAAGAGAAPAQAPVVAVMPFDDAVIRGDYRWTHRSVQWGPGAGVADLITGELVESAQRLGTFRVVERDRLFEVLAEQDLGRDGRVDPATAAQVGRILGADLLLMGAVARFDVRTDHISLPRRVGFDARRHHAIVAFEGRLVDTTTAEIVARGTGSGSDTAYGARVRTGDLAGLDFGSSEFRNSLLGRAARSAARSLARDVGPQLERITTEGTHWLATADALVVHCSERDGQWWPMINRGARDGVRVGDVLTIRRKLEDIHDPLTGELLTTLWADLGVMTIREVDEKVASGPLVRDPDAPGKPQVGDVAILRERN